jgi:type IV secretory pathway TraG/TraD family ATPase VirD4
LAEIFFENSPKNPANDLHAVLDAIFTADRGVYLGHDTHGWCHASPQQSVMVLGPPRSGKTTSLIIPNVLASPGAVISTSTKPDVLEATVGARSRFGRCLLFDPTGTTGLGRQLEPLRWSPLQSCLGWSGSLATARALVHVSGAGGGGSSRVEHSHWTERAEALLGPLLHAAALAEENMQTVLMWVDRRKALPAQQVLAAETGPATELARNLLDGIVATEERELSGIWSTASGALAGFRSEHALASTRSPDFHPGDFVASTDTVYVAAPAHLQALVAPMVVGLVNDVRFATFARDATRATTIGPVLLALDELANIAPIPDLPSMISEGGGQGLITLACFQDLSQARRRWPVHAEGFPSLFGTTVVLPGIGDVRTLDALSLVGGEEELLVRSTSIGRTPSERPLTDLLVGGRTHLGATVATQWRRRLPVDVIARGTPGYALAFDERNRAAWVPLAPSHSTEPWRSLRGPELGIETGRAPARLERRVDPGRGFGHQLGR